MRKRYGVEKKKEYSSWLNMRRRCRDQNHPAYSYYGGRGIKVCDRWLNSFWAFYSDMGVCPAGQTLERINNDADYTPENCRWATRAEQTLNQRIRKDNTTGIRGVRYEPRHSKRPWIAQIRIQGVRVYLGAYSTREQAAEVYALADRNRRPKVRVSGNC